MNDTSKVLQALIDADDEIEIEKLSDEDLKRYSAIMENGVVDANREMYKRGL